MDTKNAGERLVVIIRDDAPLVHCNDHPSYRTVTVELTLDQIMKLQLKNTHGSGNLKYYESVSQAIIE